MTTKRINLTQHDSLPEQNCFESQDKSRVKVLLAYAELADQSGMDLVAYRIRARAARKKIQ